MISPADNKENHPTISLCKKQWPIPELAPRQLRQIRSAILRFNQMIGTTQNVAEGQPQTEGNQTFVELCVSLSDENYEQLLLRPIYVALTRAHPNLKWEDFLDDFPMTDMEAMLAWFVVRRQSGLFSFEKPGGDVKPGEAGAA